MDCGNVKLSDQPWDLADNAAVSVWRALSIHSVEGDRKNEGTEDESTDSVDGDGEDIIGVNSVDDGNNDTMLFPFVKDTRDSLDTV